MTPHPMMTTGEQTSVAASPAKDPAAPNGRRRTLRKKAACCLAAAAVAFLATELAARLVYPPPRTEVREPQIRFALSPDLGHAALPNQRGWVMDSPASTNAFGFRGREPAAPKPPGLFRVMVVGSSNSFGWGVADDETFAARLGQRLPGVFPQRSCEVLNWSVPAYHLGHKERLIRFYGPSLEPDLIVLEFSPFDLWHKDAVPKYQRGGAPAAAAVTPPRPAGDLGAIPVPALEGDRTYVFNQPPAWWERPINCSRALFLARRGASSLKNIAAGDTGGMAVLTGKDLPIVTEGWAHAEHDLASIAGWASEHHCRLAVLICTRQEQVRADYPNAQYQSRMQVIADRVGFAVIDPLARFREHRSDREGLYQPYDNGHPSPLGHRLIAETIVESLQAHPGLTGR